MTLFSAPTGTGGPGAGAGESHPDTLATINNLASAYRAAGRITEAVPWLETALTRMEQVLGPDHPDTILVRKNLNVAQHEAHR